MVFTQEVNIYSSEAIINRFRAVDTSIQVVQGKISAILTDSEILELQNSKTTMYSKLANVELKVDSLTLNFSDLTTKYNSLTGKYDSLDSKVADYRLGVDGLSADITAVKKNLTDNYSTTSAMNTAIKAEVGNVSLELSSVKTTLEKDYVSNTTLKNYSTTTAMNTAIRASLDEFSVTVSNSYAKKTELTSATGKITDLEAWTQEASTKITSTAIVNTVTSSAAWKTKTSSTDVESILEQKADSIRLKAAKISWTSTYSTMTSTGQLTCTAADIKGTFRSESVNSWGTEYMQIKDGILSGGVGITQHGLLDLAAQYSSAGKHISLSCPSGTTHIIGSTVSIEATTIDLIGKIKHSNGFTGGLRVAEGYNYTIDITGGIITGWH